MSRLLLASLIGLAALGGAGAVAISTDILAFRTTGRGSELTLTRFASAREFQRYLDSVERPGFKLFDVMTQESVALPSPASPPAEMEPGNPEITNNQTLGVDEGGIVKQIGQYLVILQDGRLFSADLGVRAGAPLRLADRIDVYRSPTTAADWYDEMLVLGDRILVTAYNYRERATEITVIRMDGRGQMNREGRYLLSSDDYYSTENYATRLVGDNLVFYAPLALEGRSSESGFRWPRLRRADRDGDANSGDALTGPTDVYQPIGRVEWPVLHTVSICPLQRRMDCRTTAFIGPPIREFYVSPTDAFLWFDAPDGLPWSIDYRNRRRQDCPSGQHWSGGAEEQAAILYRLPLDGGPVGAVALDGIPADQFAFDSREGRFRALLARMPQGCLKLDAPPPLALFDLPLSDFDTRIVRAPDHAYTPLPPSGGVRLENRFLGDWLVYGGRSVWSDRPSQGEVPRTQSLVAVPLARPREALRIRLPHNALRIERAGTDMVVTGYRDADGLSLSYLSLAAAPRVASTLTLPGRFESEGRSHAFNAWIRGDGGGLIGLPTSGNRDRAERGWSDSESSQISFVAIHPDKSLGSAGALAPAPRERRIAYRCDISCIDWYGNSRPIFTGGRIFALMDTDLVEGTMAGGRIAESARIDLTGPTRREIARSGTRPPHG